MSEEAITKILVAAITFVVGPAILTLIKHRLENPKSSADRSRAEFDRDASRPPAPRQEYQWSVEQSSPRGPQRESQREGGLKAFFLNFFGCLLMLSIIGPLILIFVLAGF